MTPADALADRAATIWTARDALTGRDARRIRRADAHQEAA
jgi:hypothetical protein